MKGALLVLAASVQVLGLLAILGLAGEAVREGRARNWLAAAALAVLAVVVTALSCILAIAFLEGAR